MLSDQIVFSDLRNIEEDVYYHIPLEILERGFRYYQSGYVYNISVDHSHSITASVQGSTVYQVELDLEFFFNSSCSCPYGDYCKHIAATYFYVYSHFDSAFLLMKRWKEQRHHSRKATTPNVGIPVSHKAEKQLSIPTENSAIPKWFEFFEESFLQLKQPDFYSIYRGIQNHIQKILAVSENWQKPHKDIYTLSFYFVLLTQMEGLPEHHLWKQYYYFQFAEYRKTVQHCYDSLMMSIEHCDMDRNPIDMRCHLEEIALRLHLKILTCTFEKGSHWLLIYHQMWSMTFREWELVDGEIKRLDQQLDEIKLPPEQNAFLQYARAHFHFLMKEDDVARDRFASVDEVHVQFISPYLFSMVHWQAWDRLQAWIDWLKPKLPIFESSELRTVIDVWHRLSEHQQDDGELLETLKQLLPKSYYEYEDYLLTTKRYKHWVDLQLLNYVSPYDLDSADLKEVEINEHPSLLPLYHHAVERAIAGKNRDSYKLAVRLLKKLRAHYKKMKLQPRFEHYIDSLIQKYARLRALHEEMRKGKLLS